MKMSAAFKLAPLLPAIFRAALELGWARVIHLRITPAKILARNLAASKHVALHAATSASARLQPAHTSDLAETIAFVIPRVAARMPWRADCLIQAIAAQHWLAQKGLATRIVVGVDREGEGLLAHAWLKLGERVITGGSISRYQSLLGDHLAPH